MVGWTINEGMHREVMSVSININIVYEGTGVIENSCRKLHSAKKTTRV